MRINLAHLRHPARSGGWIDFCVFDARANSGTDADNADLLVQLTARAQANNLQVDQAALAFRAGGRLRFFGSPALVEFLSKNPFPRWTHQLDL